jgi:hypothetical protein
VTGAVVEAAAFLVTFFSATGAAAGAGAGATTSTAFVTFLVDLVATEADIILGAGEVFMAGIRSKSVSAHSILVQSL